MSQNVAQLNWSLDAATAAAAGRYPLPIRATAPAPQFPGFNFEPRRWEHRVMPPGRWPHDRLVSSPAQIIGLFAAGHYLEALAMVVSWGGMGRTSGKYIYAGRPLPAVPARTGRGSLFRSAVVT